jgi:hypothetical protein
MTTQVSSSTKLKDTKSARLLSKRVQKFLSDMEKLVDEIEKEKPVTVGQPLMGGDANKNAVSIGELMETIIRISHPFN